MPKLKTQQIRNIDNLLELQQFALEHIQETIFLVDKDAYIIYVNDAASRYLGYSKDELLTMRVFDIDPLFSPEIWGDHWDKIQTNKSDLIETTHRSKKGESIFVEVKANYIEYHGIGYNMALIRDITEQKIIERKIEHMAHHDALTGLPNLSLAKIHAEKIFEKRVSQEGKTAILFIDLDGFKDINDSLGHSLGDLVLKMVASRLMDVIRINDILSRQGGDEFLVILSDIQETNDVITMTEKLLHVFEDSFQVHNHSLSLSASIGISLYPDHGESFELLLKSADTAMYKAKEQGKNGYCIFTQQMNHNLIGQFKIHNDLKSALQNNEFILHYQPQIDLRTNQLIGVEALIRWNHPQLGMIPPMSFIPIAEDSGLIIQIGQWVIEEACRQASLWHQHGIEISVAINISAVQFRRGNLETVIIKALINSGLHPEFLELELTESIMMNDVESTLQTVQSLKSLGIQLSIDDFGTGYSSLAYLKRFAVDKLKIDQSFVRDIVHDQEDAAIVNTIIQMAKNLNLKTIAEGVETQEVLDVLHSYGCNEVQGYYFAKPMDVNALEEYVAQR